MVKVPLDARERSSCTSSYWDPAFPHLRFHRKSPEPLVGGPFWPKADIQFPHLWFSILTTAYNVLVSWPLRYRFTSTVVQHNQLITYGHTSVGVGYGTLAYSTHCVEWQATKIGHEITWNQHLVGSTPILVAATQQLLIVPRHQLRWSYGRRAFCVAGSSVWNFPAGQLAESDYWREQFQTISEDVFARNVLMHSAH